jgi:flagellar biosynthesis/type III secretory pathway protein FliH
MVEEAMGTKGMGRVIPGLVMSAEEQAARIRAEVAQEAAAARASLESARAEAARAGRQEGFEAGRQEGLAHVTATLVAAQAAAAARLESAKDAALVLARRMAEKIVGRAIELDPSVLGAIVAQALAASRSRSGTLVVRVHPEDLAQVEAQRADWLVRAETVAEVRLVADSEVGRHGCVVETPVGRLDARLETQLDALERALRGQNV